MEQDGYDIIFLGGVYAVGKSTFCEELSTHFNIESVSASTLIKHGAVTKHVKNVKSNQDVLINALGSYSCSAENLIIDGHFCLLNSREGVENIPIDTFSLINPKVLILLTLDPRIIISRLENRDSISYDIELITQLQNEEIKHATTVSKTLSIPLITLNASDDFNTKLALVSGYIS